MLMSFINATPRNLHFVLPQVCVQVWNLETKCDDIVFFFNFLSPGLEFGD